MLSLYHTHRQHGIIYDGIGLRSEVGLSYINNQPVFIRITLLVRFLNCHILHIDDQDNIADTKIIQVPYYAFKIPEYFRYLIEFFAQATVHAMLSARMRATAEEAAAPLPATVAWFGKVSVAYGAPLVAALVRIHGKFHLINDNKSLDLT